MSQNARTFLFGRAARKTVRRKVRERLVPKAIDQDEARFEIAIEEDNEPILAGVNQSISVVQHRCQVADRVPMKLHQGHACRTQVSTLDVAEVFSLIDDVSDAQPIAEVGEHWRIRRWQCHGRTVFPAG
jgi:hypothetical protein